MERAMRTAAADAAQHAGGAPRRPKVLAVASRGGHWVQLLRLREAYAEADVVFVTTVPEYRQTLEDGQTLRHVKFRVVTEATRDQKLRLALMALQMLWILFREWPDTVVTTGAAPGYAAIRLGKLLGVRTLWIDSIANAEELSLSGQLASRHADTVLTQWSHLARPGVEYRGAVV
jgi:UDP-N-acetylglucosamine:LPS N-acetylglucosamine transferase